MCSPGVSGDSQVSSGRLSMRSSTVGGCYAVLWVEQLGGVRPLNVLTRGEAGEGER